MLPTITLTPSEAKLCTLLVQCADWVDQNPTEVDKLRLKDEDGEWIGKLRGNEKVELRIAGGWVRDKVRRTRFGRTKSEVSLTFVSPFLGDYSY